MLFDPEFTLIELPKKISAVRLNVFSKILGGITKKKCVAEFFFSSAVTIAEFPEKILVLTLTHSAL